MPALILVVTSDPATVAAVSDMLADLDVRVAHGGDGSTPVPLEPRPSVIVLDTRLQGVEAATVLSRLSREAPRRPAVLVLGERERGESALAAVQAGADDALFKPLDPMGLPARVSGLLAKAALEESRERATTMEFRNQELESFIYIVTHDMKTPVVNLQGLVGLIEQDHGEGLAEPVRDLLQRLKRNAERLEQLLRDLLEYPRKLSIVGPLEERDTGVVAAAAIDGLQELSRSHGVEVHLASDMPRARCDERRLQQVFHNLVENAVKHARGVEAPRVDVGWTRTASGPRFEVRDNGPGVPTEHLQDIFRLFHRVPGTVSEGTGIGLAVARQLVEAHGGEIWCESRPGSGTTFAFVLGSA